jgi:hypothetical protein
VLALTVPISSSDYLNELSLAIFEKKHPFVKARSETKLWLCSAPASSDVNQSLIRGKSDLVTPGNTINNFTRCY